MAMPGKKDTPNLPPPLSLRKRDKVAEWFYQRPSALLGAILVWIFLSEAAIMVLLFGLRIKNPMVELAIDSTLIALFTVPGGYFFLLRPLWRQKEEYREVATQQLLLTTAIEQSDEVVIITDPKGVIVYTNPAFQKVLGYTHQELLGKDPRIINSGRQPKGYYQRMWETISAGKIWHGKFVNRCKDNTLVEMESSISPVLNRNGEVTHYVGLERDVTQESRLEAQLFQAQKLEAIGMLAGGIAHDFNNILTPILGYTELLEMKLAREPELVDYVRRIKKAEKRAQELVSQILLFSRQKQGEPKVVNPAPIFKEALKLLNSVLPSNVIIKEMVAPDLNRVKADPTQLHTILMNLCTNASHAMPDGGNLLIALENETLENFQVAPGETYHGPFIRLIVSDTGMGMDEATLNRIFEPFFTTKEVGKGTGIGLSTVFGIVKQSGGFITVSSGRGIGTIFQVHLPATEEAEETISVLQVKPLSLKAPGVRVIMLVDDDEEVAWYGKKALETLGYQVMDFTNPRHALEALKADPHKVDVLVTDQTMPGLTGEQLIFSARTLRPNLPVVMCSGYAEDIPQEIFRFLGGQGLLTKPFNAESLGKAILAATESAKGKPNITLSDGDTPNKIHPSPHKPPSGRPKTINK